jgi:lactoylglutathione lyase
VTTRASLSLGAVDNLGVSITPPAVTELRLVVTAENYPEALAFYRDVLGLAQLAEFESPDGHVVLLDAGRATLELTDPGNAAYVDRVEVGRRVAGPIRVAFQVDDAAGTAGRLTSAGAELIAPPTVTPWRSLNARLTAPDGLQLTLFEEVGDAGTS